MQGTVENRGWKEARVGRTKRARIGVGHSGRCLDWRNAPNSFISQKMEAGIKGPRHKPPPSFAARNLRATSNLQPCSSSPRSFRRPRLLIGREVRLWVVLNVVRYI